MSKKEVALTSEERLQVALSAGLGVAAQIAGELVIDIGNYGQN